MSIAIINSAMLSSRSLLLLMLFLFIANILPFGSPLSFNFPSFDKSAQNFINTTQDAFWNKDVLQLTKDEVGSIGYSTGRAVYPQPLLLWDSVTGKVTDFTTHFSFSITAFFNFSTCSEFCSGDGLAFFLAPFHDASVVPKYSDGGDLGLFSNYSHLTPSKNQLVAVEIDTYPNSWDPYSYHVGIDVNSIKSAATADLPNNNIVRGGMSNATISYSSSAGTLTVELTYNSSESDPLSTGTLRLSHPVNLSQVLPSEVAVGFSASTGASVELHQILSWDFSSTLQPTAAAPAPAPAPAHVISSPIAIAAPPKSSGNDSGKIKMLVGVFCGVGAVMAIGGVVWFIVWRRMAMKHMKLEVNASIDSDELEKGRGPKRFSINELAVATNNFAEEGKLGEGGFGMVFKGFMNGEEVAIKRVSATSRQGKKEYISEVKIISQLRHRNLVQLVGWCHDNGELLLAYKFMPNGSLDSHLYNSFLSWRVRYKIAIHLASALLYLHEEWEQCVVHRDIKPSNVMLDSAFNAKLGDFGLARFVEHEMGSQTTVLAGTLGYMAPESAEGRTTTESDVYSFGVVALEIACARKPIEPGKAKLVEWVWELYGKGNVLEAADERLQMDFDENEMERLMVIGLWCSHPYYDLRPTIRQVIGVLNFESPLPDLPREMPTVSSSKSLFKSARSFPEGSISNENSRSSGFTANSSSLSISQGQSSGN